MKPPQVGQPTVRRSPIFIVSDVARDMNDSSELN